jgi:hypothetical protein
MSLANDQQQFDERWCTAIHESGHCVVAHVLGYEVSYAAAGGELVGGLVSNHAPPGSWDAAIIDLAGIAAERRLLSFEQCRKLANGGWSGDLRNVRRAIPDIDIPRAYWTAEEIVNRNWGAIERVAEELIKRGTITGPVLDTLLYMARGITDAAQLRRR